TVRNVRRDNGTEFVNQTLREWYENVGITHQTSVARTPQQNGVVKRKNRTLIEAARTMLIFSKAPLFLWAEAINTACYTQNRSLIRLRYNKTLYELMQDKKPDLSFFYVFGSLCYHTNDHEDLEAVALRAKVLADSPVLTSIDQDAPSTSIPSSKEHEQSPIIFQSYEESPKTPTFHDDPLDESPNEDSTPQGSSSNMRLLEYEHVVYESDFARMRLQHRRLYLHLNVQFRRTSLTRFPNQSVRPFNAYVLGSPYLLVLNTGTSQSRQHDKSESDSYYLSD
ncbi:retrovirus-related pol polyprotein from transposon TNT 1-94, partial [Tanacetum coccineum]